MKLIVLLLIGCTATLAYVGDFEGRDTDLQNINVEDDFEGLLSSGELKENDEEAITQIALSMLSTGRPNCYLRVNWGQRFRHNWYISRFWECNRWQTNLRACAIPRLYQPSLERCVWAWNWRWEPIRRDDGTTTEPPTSHTTPTIPTTSTAIPPPPTITQTTSTTTQTPTSTDSTGVWPPPTTLPPTGSRCDGPICDGTLSLYLQPSHEPSQFYQCTILGRHVVLNCPTSLLFNYLKQTCLSADHWVNSC